MNCGALRMRAASAIMWLLVLFLPIGPATAADDPDLKTLELSYQPEIRHLIQRYCKECHSGDRAEADVDLDGFATWADVRHDPQTWHKVGEMLDGGQMPPKKAQQPTEAERTRLRNWVRGFLTVEAKARAGDPGRVVLRRLSNAEYTYTLRDLAGIDSLDPAREFPVDGAAGEGFTNTGNALVMSPALITKYLDAAKEIAGHAVLLPDGFRFSPLTTPRDWTEDTLARIRAFYREYTDLRGGDKVNLQGIVFDTNQGGRLPLEKYLAATIAEREPLQLKKKSIADAAQERGLNAKFLGALWKSLTSSEPSLLLNGLRQRWRVAKPGGAAALTAEIAAWQKGLWKFSTVGHIGKVGGPKAWQEPVNPLNVKQEVRFNIPPSSDNKDVTLSLVALDAGDGGEHDFVVWEQPRLVSPGRPDLLLRDVREVTHDLTARREKMFALTAKYLSIADEAAGAQAKVDFAELAQKHSVDADALRAWLEYLGVGTGSEVALKGHFTNKLTNVGGHEFINGWGAPATPQLLANSSDALARVPGDMKAHGVAVHPGPTLQAAVGWRSPLTAAFRIEASVTHAHPACGNGVTWSLELRRGATRQRLATGAAQGPKESKVGPIENVAIQEGDLVSLLIGPGNGNHSCDLTAVDLRLISTGDGGRTWDLAAEVSSDILAGNPHADRQGHRDVWHFYTEPDKGGDETIPVLPANSLLAKWRTAGNADEKRRLAEAVQTLLTSRSPANGNASDAALLKQLVSLSGPLSRGMLRAPSAENSKKVARDFTSRENPATPSTDWGLDPALFGRDSNGNGKTGDSASLSVHAPSVITFRLPAELAAGCELVTTGALEKEKGVEGSVQLEVVAGKPARDSGLLPSVLTVTVANGQWTSNNQRASYDVPIVVTANSAARKRIESEFDEFRRLFPAALCYTKIVPVDEVVTLTLFHREDEHLVRLMLDDSRKAELDRLWDELHYISHDALTLVDAFAQLMEYATQDADPKVFEPMRKPINDRAAAFRQRLIDTEPKHLDTLLEFAARAYRRSLTEVETKELRQLYGRLRAQEIPHDEAFRLTLARVLVAPAFLYRVEKPVPGSGQGPVSGEELASRLSYFLWSSQPDRELRRIAESGRLGDPETLVAQTHRMLRDAKTRRLALEFACQWLHISGFDRLDEKSERHFPTFAGLRGAMYEESIQFFTDLFQNNGSVLDVLDANYTFLNEPLAKHYGIPLLKTPPPAGEPAAPDTRSEWRRVDDVKRYGRGGILGQATTLAMQSGASRTSPILRGNWISEVLLGERLPRPPKGVPQLPDDETATEGLTVRQLVEQHSSDPKCMVCHQRIDAFGFSLEGFDAIGRRRAKDLGDRPIDTRVKAMDGVEFEGLDGLRTYLLSVRRDAFLRQFCRKFLGYALGRAVQFSDEPLLSKMQSDLKANHFRVGTAVEGVVRSRQFREIRGRESAYHD